MSEKVHTHGAPWPAKLSVFAFVVLALIIAPRGKEEKKSGTTAGTQSVATEVKH